MTPMDNAKAITLIHQLECEVNYWRIEAQTDHGRWLRALEDLEKYCWKPISTAPFDTMILVLYQRGLIGTIIFDDGYEKDSSITHWTSIPPLPRL